MPDNHSPDHDTGRPLTIVPAVRTENCYIWPLTCDGRRGRITGGGAGIIIVIVAIIVTFIRAENADKLQHIPTHPRHQSSFPLINTAETSNLAAIKWIDTQHRSNCTGGLSAKSGSNSGVLSVNPGHLTLHQITHYMGARYQIMGAVIPCPGEDIVSWWSYSEMVIRFRGRVLGVVGKISIMISVTPSTIYIYTDPSPDPSILCWLYLEYPVPLRIFTEMLSTMTMISLVSRLMLALMSTRFSPRIPHCESILKYTDEYLRWSEACILIFMGS